MVPNMTERDIKDAIDHAIKTGEDLAFDPKSGKPLRRDALGRKVNFAAHSRAREAIRARSLEILGMEPEGNTADDKYVGSTHHLVIDARTPLLTLG